MLMMSVILFLNVSSFVLVGCLIVLLEMLIEFVGLKK